MKLFYKAAIIWSVVFAAACANPLNQATSDQYARTCAEAERNHQLDVAEQACYRALVNVDWGKLGDTEKSQKMYNLARIKRQLRKFEEAEQLFKESLAIEEKQAPISKEKIGRRSAELAMVYGEQRRFEEGLPYVQRLVPIADTYEGNEKKTLAVIFYVYSQELPKQTSREVKNKLANIAVKMGFDPKTYKK